MSIYRPSLVTTCLLLAALLLAALTLAACNNQPTNPPGAEGDDRRSGNFQRGAGDPGRRDGCGARHASRRACG
jgi:hypothetical protein